MSAADRREFTITKLERTIEGYWKARVTAGGRTFDVDRKYGAWFASVRAFPGSRTFLRKDLRADVAAALQAKVRPLEKKA